MMNSNSRLRVSLKTKIWLSITGLVVVLISILWLMQIVYVEDYYLDYKKKYFYNLVLEIQDVINDNGVTNSQKKLYDIARENGICIDIVNKDGSRLINYEGIGYNCHVHSNEQTRLEFLLLGIKNPNQISVVTIGGNATSGGFFVATSVGELTNPTPLEYVLTVTLKLAPVEEATSAIKHQFLVVTSILMAIATIVALLMSRSLTKNILKINNAAKQVAGGDFSIKLEVKSNDEIGDLAKSFSEMTTELSKVNKLQKELVANISHDLRTPLTMIKGYAETIKDITGEDKETREKQLDIIVEETNRLNTLVNEVMDLSLMQAGHSTLDLSIFNLTKTISDIIERFSLLEQTSDFEFKLSLEDSLYVMGDRARIEQVLYNLIGNAVNHIGEVKVITILLEAEGDYAKVSIIDTGVGISQEDLPLIWDRYYKPYKKTTRKNVSSGLGLSIVKAILVNHSANFGVSSQINVGSNFWFKLKIANK